MKFGEAYYDYVWKYLSTRDCLGRDGLSKMFMNRASR
jgi:hypothetical protein